MDNTTFLFIGAITTGMGDAKKFLSLAGYLDQFQSILGYEPFPGTLNMALNTSSIQLKSNLSELTPLLINEWTDGDRTYGSATCYPAIITEPMEGKTLPVHVILPDKTRHGEEQLELLSPVNLRKTLALNDTDELHISVYSGTY
jgi:riboflavin kinase